MIVTKEYTMDDVLKGLECCAKEMGLGDCTACPFFYEDDYCTVILLTKAHDLLMEKKTTK